VIEQIGQQVTQRGRPVCLHYNITCGDATIAAPATSSSRQRGCGPLHQWRLRRDIAVPARNAIALPDDIPFEQGATLSAPRPPRSMRLRSRGSSR